MAVSKRPNIIMLVGEDTGLHLGCYGFKSGCSAASTPNLDALASRGRRYTNAVSTAPVCSPSRCSMVTGSYPWSIGTHHHRSRLLQPPHMFTHELRDAGYHVNWMNKTDFNFEPPADFADERSDWLNDLANGSLPDKPFFVFRNFAVTHESAMWRARFGEGPLLDRIRLEPRLKPGQHHDPAAVPVPAYLPDTPEVRGDIARYFDALSMQDAQVGDVLTALEASPYRDNTYVFYLTDHGRGLIREKRWCYEAGIHLPLLVAGPGIEAGAVLDEIVSWVDLAPTMLSLAGVDVPAHYQGQVFLGDDAQQRQVAFAGRGRLDETYDHVMAARDKNWLYLRNDQPALPYAQPNQYEMNQATTLVMREMAARGMLKGDAAVWMQPTKAPEELYDVHADPDCVRNLAASSAHASHLKRLSDALDVHLKQVNSLGALPERELIQRGLVKDMLVDYRKRLSPLVGPFQIGPSEYCALEKPE